jgi:hypothetical protein
VTEIERRETNLAQCGDLTADMIAEFVDKPLRAIPLPELRPMAWAFWSEWSHLLPNQITLAMRLRRWVLAEGLTLAEAKKAFDRVNSPAAACELKFAGELLSALTAAVHEIIDRRRNDRYLQRLREDDAAIHPPMSH